MFTRSSKVELSINRVEGVSFETPATVTGIDGMTYIRLSRIS